MRRRLFAAVGCVVLFFSFQAIAQVQGAWANSGKMPSAVEYSV